MLRKTKKARPKATISPTVSWTPGSYGVAGGANGSFWIYGGNNLYGWACGTMTSTTVPVIHWPACDTTATTTTPASWVCVTVVPTNSYTNIGTSSTTMGTSSTTMVAPVPKRKRKAK